MSSRKCRYYLAGYCRNGDNCPFLHVNSYDNGYNKRMPLHSPTILRTCRFYLQGRCAYGSGCEFFHPVGGLSNCVGNQTSVNGSKTSNGDQNSTPSALGFSFKQKLNELPEAKEKDPETLEDFGYQADEVYSVEGQLSAEELKAFSSKGEETFSFIPLLPPPENLCS